jgi:hypothetical protein
MSEYEKFVDKMSVDEMSVDKMSLDEMTRFLRIGPWEERERKHAI